MIRKLIPLPHHVEEKHISRTVIVLCVGACCMHYIPGGIMLEAPFFAMAAALTEYKHQLIIWVSDKVGACDHLPHHHDDNAE